MTKSLTTQRKYSDIQVVSSQPGIEAAMHLVRANALVTGASNDRMFLKITAGSLAGLELLWDQPSLCWVERVLEGEALEEYLMHSYNEQDDLRSGGVEIDCDHEWEPCLNQSREEGLGCRKCDSWKTKGGE